MSTHITMDTAKAEKKLKNLPRRLTQRCEEAGFSAPYFKKGETPNVCYVSMSIAYLKVEYHADCSVTCSIVTSHEWHGLKAIHLPAEEATIDAVFDIFVEYRNMMQRALGLYSRVTQQA